MTALTITAFRSRPLRSRSENQMSVGTPSRLIKGMVMLMMTPNWRMPSSPMELNTMAMPT